LKLHRPVIVFMAYLQPINRMKNLTRTLTVLTALALTGFAYAGDKKESCDKEKTCCCKEGECKDCCKEKCAKEAKK
jgi:hypothetical protein